MSENSDQARFVAADIHRARDMLLQDPPQWPSDEAVDAAGVQLLLSAMRSGLEPPPDLCRSEALRAAWARLGLDHPVDAVLSLDPPAFSLHEDQMQ